MTQVRSDVEDLFSFTPIGPIRITANGNTNGPVIDLTSKPGWKVMVMALGATVSGGFHTPQLLQATAASGSFTNLPAYSGSQAAITAPTDVRKASFRPSMPYVRANISSASVTTPVDIIAIVGLFPPTAG